MAPPTAERGTNILVLDRAPEAAGALVLPALGGHTREEAHAEHTAAPVTHLIGQRERFPGACLTLVDAAGIQRELGQLRQHAALPPGNGDFAGERRALRDELERAVFLAGVAGEGAERS